MLKRDDDSVLRVALDLEVSGERQEKARMSKKDLKKTRGEGDKKIGLKNEDALDRAKWRDRVRTIAERMK